MYIKPLNVVSFTEEEIVLNVPNAFLRDRVIDRYKKRIETLIREIFNLQVYIDIKADKNSLQPELLPSGNQNKQNVKIENKTDSKSLSLDNKFTFAKFVPGPSNELAYYAAKRISVAPGQQYNPFFYYGNTGLGKTHLLQAIGNEALSKNNDLNVIYITSEQFLDEFVYSISKGENRIRKFRTKYRQADILLLDDVHFFEGKDETQNELFNTFNLLFQNNKQMVFTSDRPPKELKGLKERMIARFSQGLLADIKPPGFEERKAILKQKIKDEKVKINPDVINFIAEKITSDVRNLEGAINKIRLLQDLKNTKLNVDEVKIHLEDMLDIVKKNITTHEIVKAVTEYYGISVADIRGKTRKKNIAKPRQMAMYLMRKLINQISVIQIGFEFGGRNHSTVSYAYETMDNEIKENISTRNDYEQIYNRLLK
jgi:chromosomal replication initiator protein